MNSKEISQKRFSRFAREYVTSQSHALDNDLDRLVELAQPQPSWLVLDIATGGGHTALKFAPHVTKVIATDITSRMLVVAQEFITSKEVTNVDFEPADAEDLAFSNASFNLVTCRIAPHHFLDCSQFVRESARVLKKGGLLLVQDHLLPEHESAACYVDKFERLRDPSHNRAFNQNEWISMLESAGLSVEHTEEIIKRHDFFPWADRQGCSPEILEQLMKMLEDAPPIAAAWLDASNLASPDASFTNHHLMLVGRK